MRGWLAIGFFATLVGAPANGTWSIIIIDTHTHEISIGSATCLTSFDLARGLPVVRVGIGAAAAQSFVDVTGRNRRRIWDEFALGTPPQQILQILQGIDSAHQTRQYGIVDVQGRTATFTGTQCGAYASGLTGQFGTFVYAIQGNVITGQPVLTMAEAAIQNTPGGIPEKLMAAMEAARLMGGDGRCSCSPSAPPSCGSPPPSFTKSAHIGFMIDSRRGDVDGTCGAVPGCVNGAYYMYFNVANQPASAPDPVIQLRQQFDAWRAGLIGIPDAVESTLTISSPQIVNDSQSTVTLRVEARDFRGVPVEAPLGLAFLHDPAGSDQICTLGAPTNLGGGVFEAAVTAGSTTGVDRFVTVYLEGTTVRYIMPSVELRVQDVRGDLNQDGRVDLNDLALLLAAYGAGPGGDIDADGDTDLSDLALWLSFV
jgi:hypothetical protein